MRFENLNETEKRAIIKGLEHIDYYDSQNPEFIQTLIDDDSITINTARSGRAVVWIIIDDIREVALYVDTLDILSDEDVKRELL